jgi:regulator of ribonuclease activity A
VSEADATWTTPDLCDAHPQVQVVEPLFRDFGGLRRFSGQIVTVRCPQDNSRVRELVASPGQGRVIVVDGGGALACALLGDMLAERAIGNGWSGLVIFGAVRDVEVLAELPLGVKALAATPRKTEKRGLGEIGVEVDFAGARFVPGHWLYADANGVILSAAPLLEH